VTIAKGDLMGLKRRGTVMISEKQAKRLEIGVGDNLTLSALTVRGSHNALDVEVVAICKDIGFLTLFNVFVPKHVVRDIYLMSKDTTGAVMIYLDDANGSADLAAKLRTELEKAKYRVMEPQADPFWMKFPIVSREAWTGQKLDVTTWEDEMSMLTWVVKAFDGLTAIVVGILLVIIVVGVNNTLWVTIRERTAEIGTLRAIGMSRPRVLLMFLLEAALLSVSATSLGAILGVAGSALVNAIQIGVSEGFSIFLMSDTLRLVVAPASVIQAVVSISLITTLFALYPAYRAARLRPVLAISHVG
jgi:ABC-type lipoprotein release transport system permease subunit